MIFVAEYSDGRELSGRQTFDDADAAWEADQKCMEATDGNFHLVLIEPRLSFQEGQWLVQHAGVQKVLRCDHRRSSPWSADGHNWESCYHAIERLFDDG